MIVALTGATGLLGGTLAERYREQGHSVKALVRPGSDTSRLEQLGVDLIYGQLTDGEVFDKLLRDAYLGIHSAALTKDFGPWEEFFAINVGATRNFMAASLKHKVAKVVHVSSVAVYGIGKHHHATDEEAPYESIVIDNYTRSKIMAEQVALVYHKEHRLPVTVIRPGYIWGAGDRAIMPLIMDAIGRKRLAVVDGGGNLLYLSHVENVADGILLAAEKDISIGQSYNLTDGSKVTTKRFLSDIIDILGIPYELKSYPYVPAYVAAYVCELYARLRKYKIRPMLTRYAVRVGKFDQVFDISRAMLELGYRPRIQYAEGMAGMTGYLRALYYGQK